jgi:hypothetical protein
MILLLDLVLVIIERLQHLWIFTYNFARMMVHLYRSLLDIGILWAALFTSLSPDLTLHMQFISRASL